MGEVSDPNIKKEQGSELPSLSLKKEQKFPDPQQEPTTRNKWLLLFCGSLRETSVKEMVLSLSR